MNTIDFLPERYRQATARRNTSFGRFAVTILFLGIFAACAGGLYVVERDVRAEYDRVSVAHAAALSQKSLVDRKQSELNDLGRYAELVTFLRHPWAKSRIIHEAMRPLPKAVTIDVVRIQAVERPQVVSEGDAPQASAESGTTQKTVATDLAELRLAAESVDIVVAVEGTTRDQPALYEYVQALSESPLFAQAELTSIEAQVDAVSATPGEDRSAAAIVEQVEAKFAVRIVVRPGWGMPGGPTADDPLFAVPANESGDNP